MSEPTPLGDPSPAPPRDSAAGSWAIILLVVAAVVAIQLMVDQAPEDDEATRLAVISLQGKMLIGLDFLPGMLERATPEEARSEQLEESAGMLRESVEQSLREIETFVVDPPSARAVAALHAFVGGESGLERARQLLDEHPATGDGDGQAGLQAAALRALDDPESLSAEDETRIREGMGWFGEVLLAWPLPRDDPRREALVRGAFRPMAAAVVLIVLAVLGLLVGLLLLIVGSILLGSGKLRLRMGPGPTGGAIYVQAFAVYLSLWLLLQIGPALFGLTSTAVGLVGLVIASAVGVLWPTLRGVPAPTAARDLGFHRGGGWLKEIAAGVVGYLAILPIVALGFLLTMALMIVAQSLGLGGEDAGFVSHPVVVWMSEGGTGTRLGILFLAAVFAPFFEEAMFRGALLRGVRARYGPVLSGLLVAFIFAVIHPQGPLAVPALMSLAFGFALLREWRDSLIAPMVGHAINNGTIVGFMWLAFG